MRTRERFACRNCNQGRVKCAKEYDQDGRPLPCKRCLKKLLICVYPPGSTIMSPLSAGPPRQAGGLQLANRVLQAPAEFDSGSAGTVFQPQIQNTGISNVNLAATQGDSTAILGTNYFDTVGMHTIAMPGIAQYQGVNAYYDTLFYTTLPSGDYSTNLTVEHDEDMRRMMATWLYSSAVESCLCTEGARCRLCFAAEDHFVRR